MIGKIYISDNGNNRIRMIDSNIITTIAGNGATSFSGDGGLATSATFNSPNGVAVDSSGTMLASVY